MSGRISLMYIVVSAFLTVLLFIPSVAHEQVDVQTAQPVSANVESAHTSLIFTGDIMLGRHVEKIILDKGVPYLFQNVHEYIRDADFAVGNFEGIVKEEHAQTPDMGFRFSIRNKFLTELKSLGFDILSFANNHSFDFGLEALKYTRRICKEIKMICVGDPREINDSSTAILSHDAHTIGLLGLQTVTATFDIELLLREATYLNASSDIQIAYVHWGDEYQRTHNRHQEELAHTLIDFGFDAVIGHHPHVVQDIELYKDKPIFYSLGNFIFDQYFSKEVQEGLLVMLSLNNTRAQYTLIPITSIASRSQPRPMDNEEAQLMISHLTKILENSDAVEFSSTTITVTNLY